MSFFGIVEQGSDGRIPVLLVGAGDIADAFLRQQRKPGEHYRVVGLLDSNPQNVGRYIHGVPVIGAPNKINHILKKLQKNAVKDGWYLH